MSFKSTQIILKMLSHDKTYASVMIEDTCSASNPGGPPKRRHPQPLSALSDGHTKFGINTVIPWDKRSTSDYLRRPRGKHNTYFQRKKSQNNYFKIQLFKKKIVGGFPWWRSG